MRLRDNGLAPCRAWQVSGDAWQWQVRVRVAGPPLLLRVRGDAAQQGARDALARLDDAHPPGDHQLARRADGRDLPTAVHRLLQRPLTARDRDAGRPLHRAGARCARAHGDTLGHQQVAQGGGAHAHLGVHRRPRLAHPLRARARRRVLRAAGVPAPARVHPAAARHAARGGARRARGQRERDAAQRDCRVRPPAALPRHAAHAVGALVGRATRVGQLALRERAEPKAAAARLLALPCLLALWRLLLQIAD
mmetsp:Transcript_11748/g.27145  ORF Transcript_11748/g.27145 Transcript_11748/m.27145 type:complete len:251 (+) Transcript_11748:1443-2195(+)